jgi:putative ABC transport system substrate-binding protein
MPVNIGRRELIAALGSAATWPLTARAQQGDRMRRVGVLMGSAQDDPQGQEPRVSAFAQGLQQLGWSDGRNVRIDIRWSAENIADTRKLAAEVVALAPDVILASGSPAVGALQQATRTVPIVFATAGDPVGAGFVDSLSRPGGNITGFAIFEYAIAGKWLELLKRFPAHDALR